MEYHGDRTRNTDTHSCLFIADGYVYEKPGKIFGLRLGLGFFLGIVIGIVINELLRALGNYNERVEAYYVLINLHALSMFRRLHS